MARKISEMPIATSLDGSEYMEVVQSGTNKRASVLAIASAGGTVSWKNSVACATTTNITLSGEQTIDGVLTSSSRVLVKNQTNQTENGIYVSAAGAWTRSTDADATAELQNAVVSVDQGTTNSDTTWRQTTDNVSVGTSNIIWTVFESTSIYKGTAAGTNTYTVTVSPTVSAYAPNQIYLIKFTNANTSSATLNVQSLGAKSIVKNGSSALESGDISAGQILELIYDGTNFQIISSPSKNWKLGGNTVGATTNFGTLDNYVLPFITNNIERGRFDTSGNFVIGATSASGRFHVRGAGTGTNYLLYADNVSLTKRFFVRENGDSLIGNKVVASPSSDITVRLLDGDEYGFSVSAGTLNHYAGSQHTFYMTAGDKIVTIRSQPGGYGGLVFNDIDINAISNNNDLAVLDLTSATFNQGVYTGNVLYGIFMNGRLRMNATANDGVATFEMSGKAYGLGVSTNQLNYISNSSHVWYTDGTTPLEVLRLTNSGVLNFSKQTDPTTVTLPANTSAIGLYDNAGVKTLWVKRSDGTIIYL